MAKEWRDSGQSLHASSPLFGRRAHLIVSSRWQLACSIYETTFSKNRYGSATCSQRKHHRLIHLYPLLNRQVSLKSISSRRQRHRDCEGSFARNGPKHNWDTLGNCEEYDPKRFLQQAFCDRSYCRCRDKTMVDGNLKVLDFAFVVCLMMLMLTLTQQKSKEVARDHDAY